MDHRRTCLLSALIAAIAATVGATPAEDRGPEAVARNCTSCHAREKLFRAARGEAAWRETVARMSSHRQRLSGEGIPTGEQDAIVAYLAADRP